MTGQDLLDRMELMNQELQLQSGEEDVTRGLLALNVAQDSFEARAAMRPNVFGSGSSTVTTSANTETTSFPSGVLRIDGLQYIDAATNRPAWDLERIKKTGGHAWNRYWPMNLVSTTSTGKPRAYWTNGTNIYWDPLPDATHTVRWYGLSSASNITAGGTFAYLDIVALPIAAFAVMLMRIGLDDGAVDHVKLAEGHFDPLLDHLANPIRDGAVGLQYERSHDT